jgi:pilus assembly protein CpaE
MAREALIIGRAAGPDDTVNNVLPRFGFTRIARTETLAHAIDELKLRHVDLVVVPLEDADDLQLATLEREIRRERHTAVIGTAPRPEPEVMLRAMRAGISEFLVSPPDAKDFSAAVDRLMRRTMTSVERGEVIAVYAHKGGVGVTSVAANLAYGFAQNHSEARAALADLVIGGGDVQVILNINPSYDLSDLVMKIDRVDSELLNSLLTPTSGGVWVLPAPDRPEAEEQIDANTIATVIQHLRSNFLFTVLDCQHQLSDRTLAALDAADRIVLLTQLSVAALRGTQRSLALFRRLGYTNDKICVVVNRYHSGEVLTPADAADVLKTDIFFKIPNDYRVSQGALTKGIPVAEFEPASKLAWSFNQLAAKLGGGSLAPANGVAVANGKHHNSGSRLRQLFVRKRSS